MFVTYCPSHGSEILLGDRSITSVTNTEHGIVIHWTCRCGHRGTTLTGQRPQAA